ncbi:hypothetical protein BH20ACT18_BH20ACT18_13090 [soil metagenome]
MRILCVGNMYPPHHLGGYELVWQGAVAHLRSLGHAVRVLTTDLRLPGSERDRRESEPDVHRELRWYWREHRWPRIGPRGRLGLERHNHAVLGRHLREQRPDVVAWWAMVGMSLSLVERVRRQGQPAVGFVHDDWMVYGPQVDAWTRGWSRAARLAAVPTLLAPVSARMAPVSARLAAVSGRLAAAAEGRTGAPTRPHLGGAARWLFVSETTRARAIDAVGSLDDGGVAPSGIDPAFLESAPEQPWRWRLLYVGRIDERKGIATAVQALACLPPAATLTIVGEGEHRHETELRALAAALECSERVRFAGGAERAALRDIYAAADATVFPVTWTEPWGLVPLESMGVGRPVVATGRGGSGEYLRDGSNCLLFEAGDAVALAASVRRLAEDPGLRARLREGGIATAPRYTEARFNEAVARAVAEAAGERARVD